MKDQPMTTERYHAFDALRASMMLLGIVLHSATAYSTFPDVWWLKDPQTSRGADLLALYIHAFRLPAFFVMSGFFAALLMARRGWQGFLENRVARLGLPFVLTMLVAYPFLKISSVFAHFMTRRPDALAATLGWLREGRLDRSIEPMHLWFLETLMLVCLGAAWAAPWLNRALGGPWFARLMGSRMAPLAWGAATFLTLLLTEFGILDTPHNFAPNFRVVCAYSVFFAFGWGVYVHRASLDVLRRGGWACLGLSVVAVMAAIPAIDAQMAQRETRVWPAFLTVAALMAVAAWLAILGLIGLFLTHASAASARQRYLSDSAYWLYLMHPPALVMAQLPMMGLNWPAEVKFVLGIAFAVPVLLWSYDQFVRPASLGVVLNGRRYERWQRQAPRAVPAWADQVASQAE
ncbi:MAG TPA: acyltransferase family protein [Paludibaculum sp.]|jgi:peptidoglycan/LPS O-acetylase OafA/YrhL